MEWKRSFLSRLFGAGQEETEEIEVVLADRKEVLRILKEEHVSLMCAYMMMHFLHDDPKKPFGFLEGCKV